MSDTAPPRLAFSYIRFSTPEQAKGDSYRRQSTEAVRYCRENGLTLADDRVYEDQGVSAYRGRNVRSGALADFRQAVEDGAVPQGSVLLVENLDRVSRSAPLAAVAALQSIVTLGVDVVTLNDRQRYTASSLNRDPGQLMMAIVTFIRANQESETKSSRLRQVWAAKRATAATRPMTSVGPAWLEAAPQGGWKVIEERAAIVREFFDETLKGVGFETLARRLNERGVAPWGWGKMWHRSYVLKTLNNRAVLGEYQPQVVDHDETTGKSRRVNAGAPLPDYYPRIVDPETFAAVQAQKAAGRVSTKRAEVRNVLAGLGRCALCGASMLRLFKGSVSRAGVPRLACSAKRAGKDCAGVTVRQDDAEQALWSVLLDPELKVQGSVDARDALWEVAEKLDRVRAQVRAIASELVQTHSADLRTMLRDAEDEARRLDEEASRLAAELDSAQPPDTVLAALRKKPGIAEANALLRRIVRDVVFAPAVPESFTPGTLTIRWKSGGESQEILWPRDLEEELRTRIRDQPRDNRGRLIPGRLTPKAEAAEAPPLPASKAPRKAGAKVTAKRPVGGTARATSEAKPKTAPPASARRAPKGR